uniref:uncharacterized protein LOC128929743 n=1 Tax=Callithrix jacchus TaxID=9483 RepID=UPI0023DD3E41|nr:uncharacterized protein LOC128929743 [Callithrix jacchus]
MGAGATARRRDRLPLGPFTPLSALSTIAWGREINKPRPHGATFDARRWRPVAAQEWGRTRKFARGRERAANERAGGSGKRLRGPWCCRRLLRGREGGAPTLSPDSAGMPEEHSGFPLKGVCTFKSTTLHHWSYVDLRV